MTVKIDGTNTVANPAFTGADTDTGLQCGTDELKLVTGGTARATVDSSGRVLVGVGSSYANSGADDLQVGNNSASTVTGISLGSTVESSIRFADAGDASSGIVEYVHASNSMRLYTNATERVRIHGDGTLAVPNGILLDPGQLSGSSTNILDDYEQGTWNPTVAFGGSSSGVSYIERNGLYIKIGSLIWASIVVSLNNNGSGTGDISISLPFPVGQNSENRGIGSLAYFSGFSGLNSNPNVYASAAGNTTCRFQHLNSSSGSGTQNNTLTHGNVTNNAGWRGSIMYTSM